MTVELRSSDVMYSRPSEASPGSMSVRIGRPLGPRTPFGLDSLAKRPARTARAEETGAAREPRVLFCEPNPGLDSVPLRGPESSPRGYLTSPLRGWVSVEQITSPWR
jgi:hypothetical protein